MDLWMYFAVAGMFLIALIGTVWITLWTIQRGERARGEIGEETRAPDQVDDPAREPSD